MHGLRVSSLQVPVIPVAVGLAGGAWAASPSACEPATIDRLALEVAAYAGTTDPITMVILIVGFAVCVRQSAMGYRHYWRLALANFVLLFFGTTGTTIIDAFNDTGDLIGTMGSNLGKFAVVFIVSVFFAGATAFWIKRFLYLLPLIAGTVLVTMSTWPFVSPCRQALFVFATAIASGLFLHWWHDCRKKPPDDKSGATAGALARLN